MMPSVLGRRCVPKRVAAFFSIAAGSVATLVGSIPGCASSSDHAKPAAEASTVPFDHDKSVQSFDVVWQTVKDKHWDPTLGGLDWEGVKTELRPKVEQATSTEQARQAMNAMLARLNQSHFGIWPQEIYDDSVTAPVAESSKGADPAPSGERKKKSVFAKPGRDKGVSGLEVRVIGKQAIVTRVAPDSAADAAGVKMGWVLVGTSDEKVADLAEKMKKAGPKGEMTEETMLSLTVQHLISGDVGDVIDAQFLDASNQPVEASLTLRESTGTPAKIGNLPTFYLKIRSERLPSNVQYFAFNIFLDPQKLMTEFGKAVESAKDADGFIVDLRGNPGGIGGLAMGMGGWFLDQDNVKLGTMYTRDGSFNFVMNPRMNSFEGPLAILVDGMSGSTSEIFAGGMKDIGRARIFGERSAGAALPSVIDVLPNGDRFQYAVANYISAGGRPLEGQGVQPDEVVVPTREELLKGHDPVLDAAVTWIRSKKGKSSTGG